MGARMDKTPDNCLSVQEFSAFIACIISDHFIAMQQPESRRKEIGRHVPGDRWDPNAIVEIVSRQSKKNLVKTVYTEKQMEVPVSLKQPTEIAKSIQQSSEEEEDSDDDDDDDDSDE